MDDFIRTGTETAPEGQDESMRRLPVDEERLQKFEQELLKYKAGKKRLERRVVEAEQWWKLRNEAEEQKKNIGWSDEFRAKSGWLHNVIVSKHADAMENYPEPIVLPREPNDRETAQTLSSVLPLVLERNRFEKVYSDCAWQKLKTGTSVYKVTWNAEKENGLGDIDITRVDLLSIFWEPGVTDIQNSRYIFHCELQDNEVLEQEYPQLKDKLNGNTVTLTKYVYDDNVPTDGKSLVVDVYYKVKENGRTVLHYCKYVGRTLLESTENDAAGGMPMPDMAPGGVVGSMPPMAQGMPGAQPPTMGGPGMLPPTPSLLPQEPEHYGLYDHGLYPFVFDTLWPVEGSPCGYGYVDLCMNTQIQLDMLDTAFLKNAMVGATPRYFQRIDGAVNEKELLDLNRAIVHVNGTLDEQSLRVIDYKPLAGGYLNFYANKVGELRETSGNTETAQGISTGGVTAASAIAALQEASGKTSRDSTKASYRAYAELINLCIELIRQFYDMPRIFRIKGQAGQEQFAVMDNSGMLPQPMGIVSEDMGYRLPLFDIKVEVQKRNAYTRTSQNELALQLFNLGFFNPQFSTPAINCLGMMDFEGKDELTQKLAANGTLYTQLQQVAQLALQLAQQYEPDSVPALMAALGQEQEAAAGGMPVSLGQGTMNGEDRRVAKARDRSNQASAPRG